jgi:hypothetical protein
MTMAGHGGKEICKIRILWTKMFFDHEWVMQNSMEKMSAEFWKITPVMIDRGPTK